MTIPTRTVELEADGEKLAGLRLIANEANERCGIVSLHGAGTATKERALYLVEELATRTGMNGFVFDFSGHGESTGTLREQRLSRRVAQAKAAFEQFAPEPRVLIGSSMGAHTALRALEYIRPQTIALFCPGIYARNAYDVPFTEAFTDIIRRPESWQDSDALDALESYEGNLLVVIGEKDEVIPSGVIDLLDSRAVRAKRKAVLRIPGGTHAIHTFLNEHPEAEEEVLSILMEMIEADREA